MAGTAASARGHAKGKVVPNSRKNDPKFKPKPSESEEDRMTGFLVASSVMHDVVSLAAEKGEANLIAKAERAAAEEKRRQLEKEKLNKQPACGCALM